MIPTGHSKQIELDRATLLQALQRAAILSNEKFRGVRWCSATTAARSSARTASRKKREEELEVDYKGDALDIGFNITYLLDVLQQRRRATRSTCAFGDANSSALVTLPERDDFKYVVMPMRI